MDGNASPAAHSAATEQDAVSAFGIVAVKGDAVAVGGARPQRRFFERIRFQVGAGLLVCVLCPWVFRAWYDGVALTEFRLTSSAIISSIALLVGYYASRSMMPFRGATIATFSTPTLAASFALAALVPLFARIEYSRLQLGTHFILAVIFFIITERFINRRRNLRFAVIPGGRVGDIPQMDRVDLRALTSHKDEITDVDGLIADMDVRHSRGWDMAMTRAMLSGIPIYHWRQLVEQLSGTVQIDQISENSLGSLNPNQFYVKIKEVTDPLIALVALILLAPIMVLIAIAIRLESPGFPIFSQKRTGYRAQTITVFKFRTMYHVVGDPKTPEEAAQRAMTRDDDPRITRVGRVLRKTRLDEIPQLLNVVMLQMSLIGPRPEALPLTLLYERELPFYHYRHIIKPGITGWAQVNQGHVTSIDDIRRKLCYDFYYVKFCSIWLDFLIIGRTVITAITAGGAR